MKVLFIGGTGIISSACSALALARKMEVSLITRGTSIRPVPQGARHINVDIRNPIEFNQILADDQFDVVVDFMSFVPDHVKTVLCAMKGRFNQCIFISSASA